VSANLRSSLDLNLGDFPSFLPNWKIFEREKSALALDEMAAAAHAGVCVYASCSVVQCVVQCVAVCCSVLQCVAACCSVLQCVALFGNAGPMMKISVCVRCLCVYGSYLNLHPPTHPPRHTLTYTHKLRRTHTHFSICCCIDCGFAGDSSCFH